VGTEQPMSPLPECDFTWRARSKPLEQAKQPFHTRHFIFGREVGP
jgi:hypothetical protein